MQREANQPPLPGMEVVIDHSPRNKLSLALAMSQTQLVAVNLLRKTVRYTRRICQSIAFSFCRSKT